MQIRTVAKPVKESFYPKWSELLRFPCGAYYAGRNTMKRGSGGKYGEGEGVITGGGRRISNIDQRILKFEVCLAAWDLAPFMTEPLPGPL